MRKNKPKERRDNRHKEQIKELAYNIKSKKKQFDKHQKARVNFLTKSIVINIVNILFISFLTFRIDSSNVFIVITVVVNKNLFV